MTLPTGQITMAQVATELGISSTNLNLNDSRVRALAGKTTGQIAMSDLRGKSSVKREPASGENYVAGQTEWAGIGSSPTNINKTIRWGNTEIGGGPLGTADVNKVGPYSGWYYYRGTLKQTQPYTGNPGIYLFRLGVYRMNV